MFYDIRVAIYDCYLFRSADAEKKKNPKQTSVAIVYKAIRNIRYASRRCARPPRSRRETRASAFSPSVLRPQRFRRKTETDRRPTCVRTTVSRYRSRTFCENHSGPARIHFETVFWRVRARSKLRQDARTSKNRIHEVRHSSLLPTAIAYCVEQTLFSFFFFK